MSGLSDRRWSSVRKKGQVSTEPPTPQGDKWLHDPRDVQYQYQITKILQSTIHNSLPFDMNNFINDQQHQQQQQQSNVPSTVKSSSYQNVTHKKVSGTVILTDSHLTFYPLSTGVASEQSPWTSISKHQVSPITHARHLLKIVFLQKEDAAGSESNSDPKGKENKNITTAHTYEFQSRNELERIRNDISARLVNSRRIMALNSDQKSLLPHAQDQRKRKIGDISSGTHPEPSSTTTTTSTTNLTSLSTYEQSVSCSSILASDRNVRTQHSLLTAATAESASTTTTHSEPILQENDFWSTHGKKVSNQYAKIQGYIGKGISSSIKSSLDIQISGNIVSKPIRLGVDEIRQIFIMYPAVHAAYEEKVPLELSEEQFWRKYLESEYFHRDRGRLNAFSKALDRKDDGMISSSQAMSVADGSEVGDADKKSISKEEDNKMIAKEREESARMGAASSNDIFSRKEMELQRIQAQTLSSRKMRQSSVNIAFGQFDLTSTANTERGSKLLLKSSDLEPSDDRSRKVIEKYNKHWAIVLNPDLARAGCNVSDLVHESVNHVVEGDDDAKALGGVGREMHQLVRYANARDNYADTRDSSELVLYKELKLANINRYTFDREGQNDESKTDIDDRDMAFAQSSMELLKSMVQPLIKETSHQNASNMATENAFPDPNFGKNLLLALTKHMVRDAMTDKDTAKQVKSLPEEFRSQLISYTRRSSELLRHFFALRHVIEEEQKLNKPTLKSARKLEKIVKAMEGVFRELESKRNELPQSERGDLMRVMMLQTMEQLDWAIQLNPKTSRSSGGFVTVAD
jgi:transcription initiation factor TFIIH subunit 1